MVWALLLWVSVVGRGVAQAVSGVDPLAVPAGAISCQMQADSTGVVVRLSAGDDPGALRDIRAAFDSVGTPLFLVVFAPERMISGRVKTDAFYVRWGASSRSLHRVLDET